MQADKGRHFLQRHVRQKPFRFPYRKTDPSSKTYLRRVCSLTARAVQGSEQCHASLERAGLRKTSPHGDEPAGRADQPRLLCKLPQRSLGWSFIGIYETAHRFENKASNSMAKGLNKNDSALIHRKNGNACDELAIVNPRRNDQVVLNLTPVLISDVIRMHQKL